MTTTRWTTLSLAVVVGLGTGWLLVMLGQDAGWALLAPPATVLVITALLALGTLATAWPLRRWNRGHRDRPINPLRAARTLALAKASGLTGGFLTGVWLAVALYALPRLDAGAQLERVLANVAAVAVSAALLGAGALAERWCRIPPEDDGGQGSGARAPGGVRA